MLLQFRVQIRAVPPLTYNFQPYEHSSAFFHLLPRRVRYAEGHRGSCEDSRGTPATCTNCGRVTQANYRGCVTNNKALAKQWDTDRPLPLRQLQDTKDGRQFRTLHTLYGSEYGTDRSRRPAVFRYGAYCSRHDTGTSWRVTNESGPDRKISRSKTYQQSALATRPFSPATFSPAIDYSSV